MKLLFILILTTGLSACGGNNAPTQSPQDSTATLIPDLHNGAYLFNYHCSGCHGIYAQGKLGPNIQGKSAADIRYALNTVDNMSYLPDFSDQELTDITAYLKTLINQPPAYSALALIATETCTIPKASNL